MLDSGAVQSDALTVDRRRSLEGYAAVAARRAGILAREEAFIRSARLAAAYIAIGLLSIRRISHGMGPLLCRRLHRSSRIAHHASLDPR